MKDYKNAYPELAQELENAIAGNFSLDLDEIMKNIHLVITMQQETLH